MENNNDNKGCVCQILKKEVENKKTLDTCDRLFLGNVPENICNTRPFTLLCCNGRFKAFFQNGLELLNTEVFRVEKVDKCCAQLRCLQLVSSDPLIDPIFDNIYNPAISIQATNNFVAVNLNCICGIQCLTDIHLNLC